MPTPPPATVEQFFFRHWKRIQIVSESGCFIWMGALCCGYGEVKILGEGRQLAHRVAYRAVHGEIPEAMFVRHACDIPCCVNPCHLQVGTQAENMQDMKARNRQSKGSNRPFAKLSSQEVRVIRQKLESGVSQSTIAAEHGVSQPRVSRIKTGKLWSHVK